MASEPVHSANTLLPDGALDPLASPVLQQELPGITTAFDTEAMRARLQVALFADNRPPTITECEVEQATYTPGAGCTVRYILTLPRHEPNTTNTVLVSAQLFCNAHESAAFFNTHVAPLVTAIRGRPEVNWCDQPAAHVEDLAMVLFAYPLDGELPALLQATDNPYMLQQIAPYLAETAPTAAPPSTCHTELVDYGRQRRCTLRYQLSNPIAETTTIYGKLTGDGSGVLAEAVSNALAVVGQSGVTGQYFGVPKVLAWLPELQLSLLETLPGQDIISDLLKSRLRGKPAPAGTLSLERTIEAGARIAAALHTSGIGLGPRRDLSDELARLEQAIVSMAPASPELSALLATWHQHITERAARSPALPLCFNHGDFTAGQILFDGENCGLIDFDSVCQAEPALDVAQFVTYLTVGGQKSKHSAEETRAIFAELTERFIQTYSAAAGYTTNTALLQSRVSLYRSISLLRRVIRSWQKMKPSRIAGALAMVQEALAEEVN